jgi:hypothetical protein
LYTGCRVTWVCKGLQKQSISILFKKMTFLTEIRMEKILNLKIKFTVFPKEITGYRAVVIKVWITEF